MRSVGSDELFDALSCPNTADLAGLADDPAARMLAALAADVDAGAPPIPAAARAAFATPGTRRRGVVAIVTFGAAVIMLASPAAAAAGGRTAWRWYRRARTGSRARRLGTFQRERRAASPDRPGWRAPPARARQPRPHDAVR